MFNLQTLTAKARELRGNVVKTTTTKGTRTMTPVYEREEQRKLRERIQRTQPDWVLLWWDIATVTGWRTSDVQLPLLVHQLGNRHSNNYRSEADQSSRSRGDPEGDRDCSPAAQGRCPACWRSHCLHAMGIA